ncbi:MAG: AAA family ATPase [Opitutales bacterium]|nr:AAA family ATPase [Opitutales bacterium]
MSENEKEPPLDDINRQFEKLFGGKHLPFGIPAFMRPDAGIGASQNDGKHDANNAEQEAILKRIREFNLKPKEIREHLDRYVIRQDEAKKVLSVAVCDHFNHVRDCIEHPERQADEYHKQNILLLGPTGVGKTYLMRTIAKLIGVPFVKADATKFSETGYVGADVEDLIRDLVKAANGNIDLAQYGIVYIDEIDKIANAAGSIGKDVSGRGVQINLLKLMEEADVNQFSPTDIMAQMQAMMGGTKSKGVINTRHILFIVSGAFDKITDIIRKRLNHQKIGFDASGDASDDASGSLLQGAETRDFIEYGFEPEFVGRLPVRVACEPLSADDLALIMTTSEGSILKQYHRDFEGFGIDLEVSVGAIRKIASRAYLQKTGARGILTVLERIFRDFKFELPSTGIRKLSVDEATVENPSTCLEALLRENLHLMADVHREDIERFFQGFFNETGIQVEIDPDGLDAIVARSTASNLSVRYVCEALFKDARHGLAIVMRNTGTSRFTLSCDFVQQPDAVISRMVVESFKSDPARETNP